jgi:hypothetical protein
MLPKIGQAEDDDEGDDEDAMVDVTELVVVEVDDVVDTTLEDELDELGQVQSARIMKLVELVLPPVLIQDKSDREIGPLDVL